MSPSPRVCTNRVLGLVECVILLYTSRSGGRCLLPLALLTPERDVLTCFFFCCGPGVAGLLCIVPGKFFLSCPEHGGKKSLHTSRSVFHTEIALRLADFARLDLLP